MAASSSSIIYNSIQFDFKKIVSHFLSGDKESEIFLMAKLGSLTIVERDHIKTIFEHVFSNIPAKTDPYYINTLSGLYYEFIINEKRKATEYYKKAGKNPSKIKKVKEKLLENKDEKKEEAKQLETYANFRNCVTSISETIKIFLTEKNLPTIPIIQLMPWVLFTELSTAKQIEFKSVRKEYIPDYLGEITPLLIEQLSGRKLTLLAMEQLINIKNEEVNKNIKKAKEFLDSAIKKDQDPFAHFMLACLFGMDLLNKDNFIDPSEDDTDIISNKHLIIAENADIIFTLPSDNMTQEQISRYTKLAEKGSSAAQFILGLFYYDKKNPLAKIYLQSAFEKGYILAAEALGDWYYEKEKNIERAAMFYRYSREEGAPRVSVKLKKLAEDPQYKSDIACYHITLGMMAKPFKGIIPFTDLINRIGNNPDTFKKIILESGDSLELLHKIFGTQKIEEISAICRAILSAASATHFPDGPVAIVAQYVNPFAFNNLTIPIIKEEKARQFIVTQKKQLPFMKMFFGLSHQYHSSLQNIESIIDAAENKKITYFTATKKMRKP